MRPNSPVARSLVAGVLALLFLTPTPAAALELHAKQAIVIDATTGDILLEKNADEPVPPASMSKLMTVYMVFERLKDGRLKLTDKFKVSEKAWKKGGSKMFVRVNTMVSVEDLLQGIIVQSGNDACIVVAEGLAGSEDAFAEEMTAKARELGLKNSTFKNATGWPVEGHLMSVHDIARLSKLIIQRFPEYYHYFAETEFTYSNIRQANRNPLLYGDFGADGLKTGHTQISGYGLAASAERDGRRIITVIHGLESEKQRASEAVAVMSWAFREFDNYAFFRAGEAVEEAAVWLGESDTVPLIVENGLTMTLPRNARKDLEAKVVFTGPLPAPIAKGTPVARLVISAPGVDEREIPLLAGADVQRLGPIGRLGAALRYAIWGSEG